MVSPKEEEAESCKDLGRRLIWLAWNVGVLGPALILHSALPLLALVAGRRKTT